MTLVTIAAVERETGLSKDTLRVWERRYGFPRPVRDARDERRYPADQVERLRLIRRLIDLGFRPGRVVGATLRELTAFADTPARGPGTRVETPESLRELMALVESGDGALRAGLARELMRLGLPRFANEVIAPLNELVGEAWARGRIAIWHEHLYTEHAQSVLREGIAAVAADAAAPRVLLATVPGEGHQLGLLLAQACLALEGADCIALGPEIPLQELCRAAGARHADVVGLSFSPSQRTRAAWAVLRELRRMLDRRIVIWAGGSVWARQRGVLAGVQTIPDLHGIPDAVAAWRRQRRARASTVAAPGRSRE